MARLVKALDAQARWPEINLQDPRKDGRREPFNPAQCGVHPHSFTHTHTKHIVREHFRKKGSAGVGSDERVMGSPLTKMH